MPKTADYDVLRQVLALLKAMARRPHTRLDVAELMGCTDRQGSRLLATLQRLRLVRAVPGSAKRGPGGTSQAYVAAVRVTNLKP